MEKPEINFQREIDLYETHLRKGRLVPVRKGILNIDKQRIPQKFMVALSEIARRVDLPEFGLELIGPHINSGFIDPELDLEYCFCLKEIGAAEESAQRLSQLDPQKAKVLICRMHLALCLWDFDEVINTAKIYLDLYDPQTYQAAVVKTNLASALAAIQSLDKAHLLLNELIADCSLNEWIRLQGNAHEISAQVCLYENDFKKAQLHIDRAKKISLGQDIVDQLLVERWSAVLVAQTTGSIEQLEALKERATEKRHFGLCRAVDYELLRFRFTQKRYDFLYFGTPYTAYRKMLEQDFGPASDQYTINPQAQYQLILSNGTCNGQKICKPGGKLHNILSGLLRDFYRPMRTGAMFGYIFPDELLNPEYSFKRVYQLMYRTRQWLTGLELPLTIESTNGEYRLNIPESVGITIEKKSLISYHDLMLEQLANKFGRGSFTSRQTEVELQISSASANRILKAGLLDNKLSRVRRGRSVAYMLTVNSQK